MKEQTPINIEPNKEIIADTGVVIGKFYPPHLGHKYLIDTASSKVNHLSVIICHNDDYKIPGEIRANWLREIHPNVDVMLREDSLPGDDSKRWAEATLSWLGYTPQLVFTSEDYGETYATAMGSQHIPVDKQRKQIPISGTKVWQDPLENLTFLEPCVRSYFVKRICVLGAESTGTTTLSRELAHEFDTVWVQEFGRDYSVQKIQNNQKWSTADFEIIAAEQQRKEDEMARVANKVLICDTNAFATGIWHERYIGKESQRVNEIGGQSKADLYIVTGDEIPFVQDGTRDGEHIRHWMHERFIDELQNRNLPYIVLSGSREERLTEAKSAVGYIIKHSPSVI